MARKQQKRHNTGRNHRRPSGTARQSAPARQSASARSSAPARDTRRTRRPRPQPRRLSEAEMRRRQRARRRQTALLGLAVLLVVLIFALRHLLAASQPASAGADSGSAGSAVTTNVKQAATAMNVSQSVMYYQPVVQKYAEQNDIAEYTDTLLAIMQVESGGELTDVMQSSGSAELPNDSLEEEASIRQGCTYFAHLLRKGKSLGCDLDCVIQAYNYGSGFLDYAAKHGGVYNTEIAEDFAEQQSGGSTIQYDNPLAVAENGGWRYAYGNMFYARLVKQYLAE